MIVKNPTESDLEIQYQGVNYSVPANGEASIPDEVALHWRDRIHQFIELAPESDTEESPKSRKEAVDQLGEESVKEMEDNAPVTNSPEEIKEILEEMQTKKSKK